MKERLDALARFFEAVDAGIGLFVEGRAFPAADNHMAEDFGFQRLVSIHSGDDYPEDAFTVVQYRDHYFWVDDRDFHSKKMLNFLMFLFSLASTQSTEGEPVLTISAG